MLLAETCDERKPLSLSFLEDFAGFCSAARFLQRPLAKIISSLRAPKSSEGYKRIGGGSPLRRITEQQADALAAALKSKGLDAKVYVGMRYWSPFIEDAMQQVMGLSLLFCTLDSACRAYFKWHPKVCGRLWLTLGSRCQLSGCA